MSCGLLVPMLGMGFHVKPWQPGATEEDTYVAYRPPYPGAPRWVKVSGIIGIVVVLMIGIILVTGGGPGGHDPGRHTSAGDAGDDTPPIERVAEDDGADPPRGTDGPDDHAPPIEHGP